MGIAVLLKALKFFKSTDLHMLIRIRIGSLYEKQESWEKAFSHYAWVVKTGFTSWQGKIAGKRITELMNRSFLLESDLKKFPLLIRANYLSRNYKAGLKLIQKNMTSIITDKSMIKLYIKLLCRSRRFSQMKSFLKKYDASSSDRPALLKAAVEELWSMGKRGVAIPMLNELASSNREPFTYYALKKLSRLYIKRIRRNNTRLIKRFYKKYPEDLYSGYFLWMLGKNSIRKKKNATAIQYLKKSLKILPKGKYSANCRFWLYKLMIKQGDRKQAQSILVDLVNINPDSSYTLPLVERLAGKYTLKNLKEKYKSVEKTGIRKSIIYYHALLQSKEQNIKSRKNRIEDITVLQAKLYQKMYRAITTLPDGENADSVASLEKYFEIGYTTGIKREIAHLRNRGTDSHDIHLALAYYGIKYRNAYYSAYNTLKALKDKSVMVNIFLMPEKLLKLLYPRPFNKCVKTKGKKYSLKSSLIYSVIRAESMYRNTAVSRSGAVGLMQLMPATAKELAKKMRLKQYRLEDPCTSIEMGSRYLRWLKKIFKGDISMILAGYNAGHGRMKRWKRKFKKTSDLDYFIEFIPYYETRYYVLRIRKFMQYYKYLYRI